MQACRVYPVYAAGGQEIAILNVHTRWNELQIQRTAQGVGVAAGHMTATSSGVHDRYALASVREQSDFADQRVDTGDLPYNARRVDDSRSLDYA
jgi:hypothetical protein